MKSSPCLRNQDPLFESIMHQIWKYQGLRHWILLELASIVPTAKKALKFMKAKLKHLTRHKKLLHERNLNANFLILL